jgi:hypothetical protein
MSAENAAVCLLWATPNSGHNLMPSIPRTGFEVHVNEIRFSVQKTLLA